MIRIQEIQFENYRQYKKISVDFKTYGSNDLFVLKAKNGTGKTTFLNGILWCLYEKEYYLNDEDKALPIINSSLVQSSNEKDTLVAKVVLNLDDGDNIITFERTQNFIVTINPIKKTKSAVSGNSKLKVIITPSGSTSNTMVYEDEEMVQSFVKQYFDELIYDYYFFDGENLKNYFAKGKSKRIKDSIHNISQVTLLTNAIDKVNVMSNEKSRSVARMKNSDGSVYDEIEKLEKRIQKLVDENDEIDRLMPEYERKFKEADDLLTGYRPIRSNTNARNKLLGELEGLNRDFEIFKTKKQTFIREYLVYLNLYPRIKHTLDMIVEKQTAGTLPPSIDKNQINLIIDNHVKHCPVCDSLITAQSIHHLKELLEQLDVSSATSNYLMEIKGSLEIIVEKCMKFPDELKVINKNEKYYRDEISEREAQIEEINSFLANYANGGDTFDVAKVEANRNTYSKWISDSKVKKGINENQIKGLNLELETKKKERDQQESKNTEKNLLSNQVKVYRTLSTNFSAVQNSIMNNIKTEIQALTWHMFDTMIWKKNTFGSISINDAYELSVYNRNGNEMTGSLSATEYMALAYSFTLAIHEASGKNCPLVVDSPLGRVSDENRANMAAELLKVSRNKQIIMLFTPDEYSEEVRKIYESVASVRDIVLSGDEKEVERVGA